MAYEPARRRQNENSPTLSLLQGWMTHNKLVQRFAAIDSKAMLIGQVQQTDETQVHRQILCPARSTESRYIRN